MIQVNLNTLSAYKNKTVLAENGVLFYAPVNPAPGICRLKELYEIYKHSLPHNSKTSRYFIALSSDELTEYDLFSGISRDKAQEQLEMATLEAIISKSITWPDDKLWFWQPSDDPDFILLRQWFDALKKGDANNA